ncbi:MAG: DUF222 domain-containing protein [Nitriliruptoraceae bacterium]|nr:DUF222 domain-containing protein [Nitriliruptoraceae bacterium]
MGDADAALAARLLEVVEALDALDVTAWDRVRLDAHLRALAAPLRRLQAHRSVVMSAAVETHVERVPEARQDRARRQLERDIGQQQGLTLGESRRASAAGRAARKLAEPGRAFRSGALSERHVEQLARTLERVPTPRRAAVERELLALARRLDPAAFGREARAIEGREAPAAADRRARFEHSRRFLHVHDNEAGGVDLRGRLSGLSAERFRVALDAFRTFDGEDDTRSSEQRAADALSTLADVALRSGDAGTSRNVRPHVIVIAEADELRRADGAGRLAFSGEPVRWSELGATLGDCALTSILRDGRGAPIAVSSSVRTVPVGAMKGLIARDRGCAWAGCQRPWTHCQVAHGRLAFRDGGRLRIDDAALLCDEHHRRFDSGWWDIRIEGGRVGFDRRATRREVPAAWDAMLGESVAADAVTSPSARCAGSRGRDRGSGEPPGPPDRLDPFDASGPLEPPDRADPPR